MNGTPKDIFGTFARIEMLTWALLIAAIIARETIGVPSNIFFIVGATHGLAFMGYAATSTLVAVNQRWPLTRGAFAVILAIVPFATLPFDRYLEKKKHLEGAWRIDATNDPRDKTRFDRLFRWYIERPLFLVLTLAVFVIALFFLLLWVGPPYQAGS